MTPYSLQRKKRGVGKRIGSPLGLILLFVLAVLLVRGAAIIAFKARDAYFLAERSVAERDRLLERREELKKRVERLDTDLGVESELRARFGVALPEEEMVLIIDSKASTSAQRAITPTPWWKRLWPF